MGGALTLEEPRHDFLAELLRVADTEGLPRGRPADHLGILRLEDLEQAQGECLPRPALAEALLLLRSGSGSGPGLWGRAGGGSALFSVDLGPSITLDKTLGRGMVSPVCAGFSRKLARE